MIKTLLSMLISRSNPRSNLKLFQLVLSCIHIKPGTASKARRVEQMVSMGGCVVLTLLSISHYVTVSPVVCCVAWCHFAQRACLAAAGWHSLGQPKKLSRAQLEALEKCAQEVVTSCFDNCCHCTTGGLTENEWQTVCFRHSFGFDVKAASDVSPNLLCLVCAGGCFPKNENIHSLLRKTGVSLHMW